MLCPLEITGISDAYAFSLRYTLERCPSRSTKSFTALKAVQLGELTSFRRVTSKSDSIFAVESRFYVHYQSQCEDTVMKIQLLMGSEENNQLNQSCLSVGFSGDFCFVILFCRIQRNIFSRRQCAILAVPKTIVNFLTVP